MSLAEVPLLSSCSLGLAAYTVLGGADFGAGLWQLLAAGPRGRATPRATLTTRWGRSGRPTTSG